MAVLVRVAEPHEYDAVGELTVEAYRTLPMDHLWGGYAEEIRDVAARAKEADVLVAVDTESGELLGAATFVSEADSAWLEWNQPGDVQFRLLAVSASARRRGVGEALVRDCIARAGGRSILIHTTQWMTSAQRLYERFGFVRDPSCDVPEAVWRSPSMTDVPPEWNGVPFLAYRSG